MKKFAIFIATLLVSSCGTGLPEKPSISDCRVILDEAVAFCINNQSGQEYDIPLSATDRWVLMSPNDWSELLIYVKLLENNIRRKSHKDTLNRELNKLLETDSKHRLNRHTRQRAL